MTTRTTENREKKTEEVKKDRCKKKKKKKKQPSTAKVGTVGSVDEGAWPEVGGAKNHNERDEVCNITDQRSQQELVNQLSCSSVNVRT